MPAELDALFANFSSALERLRDVLAQEKNEYIRDSARRLFGALLAGLGNCPRRVGEGMAPRIE